MTETTKTTAKTVTEIARSIARILGKTLLCCTQMAIVWAIAALALPIIVIGATSAPGWIALVILMAATATVAHHVR